MALILVLLSMLLPFGLQRVPRTCLGPVLAAASGEKIIADVNHKAGRCLNKGGGKLWSPDHRTLPLPFSVPGRAVLLALSSLRERGFSFPLTAAFVFAFRAQIPRPREGYIMRGLVMPRAAPVSRGKPRTGSNAGHGDPGASQAAEPRTLPSSPSPGRFKKTPFRQEIKSPELMQCNVFLSGVI